MQLTIFTDYGLRSLMYLAVQPGRRCTIREIAANYGISRNHIVKVVHRLVQLGYVASSKGKGGGIKLAFNAKELRLGDLVKHLESSLSLVECFDHRTNTCKITSACQMKHYLQDAADSFIATLNKHTLADAINDNRLFLSSLSIASTR